MVHIDTKEETAVKRINKEFETAFSFSSVKNGYIIYL